jgi:hypothetical protein
MKWARHVAYAGMLRKGHILVRILKGTSHLIDLGIDGRMTLRWILTY